MSADWRNVTCLIDEYQAELGDGTQCGLVTRGEAKESKSTRFPCDKPVGYYKAYVFNCRPLEARDTKRAVYELL